MTRRLTNLELAAFLGIVFVAAAMRIWWNDVEHYSPADETVYAGYTRQLAERGFVSGYPEIVSSFVQDRTMWRYPNPLRWGYLGLATLTAHAYGSAEPHALAWLSTIAGILVVPAVFWFALSLFGVRIALLASAFTAFSSIEMALGRRALQDEVFCLATLIAVALLLVALEKDSRRLVIAFVAAATLAIAVKETFLFLYPGLIAAVLVYRKPRQLATLALPPLLWCGGFAFLARSASAFFDIGRILTMAADARYALQYQSGPPHRPLFDFFATAPLVSILAILALRNVKERRDRALVLFAAITIAVFGVIPSQNLRFTMVVDPFVRLLAASAIATLPAYALIAFAAANATIELELFHVIFIRGEVYDPVTQELFASLAALPRSDAAFTGRMLFPWICAVIAAAAWGWSACHPERSEGPGRRVAR